MFTLNKKRRQAKVRAKIKGTSKRPRLSVNRSNRGVRVQLIDDVNQKTLFSAMSVGDKKKTPMENAKSAGERLAKEAKAKGVKKVVFDRGGFAYHGLVKMVAEGARDGGLEF